jgi:hypothetical protein
VLSVAAIGTIGWAAGAVAGLVDGLVGRSTALVPTWTPLLAGVLLWGGAGLVLGSLVGAVVGRAPRGVGAASLVALVATGVGVGLGAPRAAERPGADVPRTEGDAANAVWITIDGLTARDLDRMPFTRAWVQDRLELGAVFAASPDRRATLEATLSGRLPAGRAPDAPRVADVARSYGLVPLAVLQGDDAADRGVVEGFAAARSAVSSRGVRRLGTALARAVDPGTATPSSTVRAARALLDSVPGRRYLLVVELPALAPREQLDDAIRALVTLTAERRAERDTVVLLSGLTGRAGDAPSEPDRPSVHVPAWLTSPDVDLVDGALGEDLGSVDLMPTLLYRTNPRDVQALDGRVVERRGLEESRRVRLAGEGRRFSGDPVACGTLHLQTSELVAASEVEGGARAVRLAGWAVVQPPSGPLRLYDEVVDPFWVHDLVALGAGTCEGTSAADRAADLVARRDRAAARSAEGVGRIVAVGEYPLGPPRALFPDPRAGLVRR